MTRSDSISSWRLMASRDYRWGFFRPIRWCLPPKLTNRKNEEKRVGICYNGILTSCTDSVVLELNPEGGIDTFIPESRRIRGMPVCLAVLLDPATAFLIASSPCPLSTPVENPYQVPVLIFMLHSVQLTMSVVLVSAFVFMCCSRCNVLTSYAATSLSALSGIA